MLMDSGYRDKFNDWRKAGDDAREAIGKRYSSVLKVAKRHLEGEIFPEISQLA